MAEYYSLPYFDGDGNNTAQTLNVGRTHLHKIIVENPNSATAYVQIFDALAADVTVGTTTPDYVIPVLGNSGTVDDYIPSLRFKTGVTYACTTTPTGNTDPTTGLVLSATYS